MKLLKPGRFRKLLRFSPTPDTFIAFTAGIGMILLSLVLLLVKGISHAGPAQIILQDVLMVFFLGFCFPIYYILLRQKHGLRCLGFTKKRLKRSLEINLILALCICIFFINITPVLPQLSYNMLCAVIYLLATGVFETVFFYGFMRYHIDKAFGLIPAIILTAALYSLHHVGFEPEFIKFFLWGLVFTSFFYITRNIFIIFPFSWLASAFWDVYFKNQMGSVHMDTTELIVGIGLLIAMAVYTFYLYRQTHQKQVINKLLTIPARSIQISSKNRHFNNI